MRRGGKNAREQQTGEPEEEGQAGPNDSGVKSGLLSLGFGGRQLLTGFPRLPASHIHTLAWAPPTKCGLDQPACF